MLCFPSQRGDLFLASLLLCSIPRDLGRSPPASAASSKVRVRLFSGPRGLPRGLPDAPGLNGRPQSGNLSVSGIISQAIAGGAGGAILTAIIGAIKNKVAA
jgi:hypothetical protein